MSLVIGGSRIYYHDPVTDSYVCYCTLHHKIQVITQDRDAAEYYLKHGVIQFQAKYPLTRVNSLYGIEKHQYMEWRKKMVAKFGYISPLIY